MSFRNNTETDTIVAINCFYPILNKYLGFLLLNE